MSRLGGASQRSYLLDRSGSATQTVTSMSSSHHSESRESYHGQGQELLHVRGNSASPPSSGRDANQVSHRTIPSGSSGMLSDYSTDSRTRTYSTPTLRRNVTDTSPSYSEGSLRRRSRLSDASIESPVLSRHTSSPASYMIHSPLRKPQGPRRFGHIVQAVVVFVIMILVWDSNHKVGLATEQLLRYQREESQLILQMNRVEGRANDLRAKIKAFKESEAKGSDGASAVEPALKSMRLQQELARLEHEDQEVSDELQALQARIQKSALESIRKMYGDGILHVNLQLQLHDGPGNVVLELSDNTPHAVWVWLQQIIRHDWDDSMFRWRLEHVILATPARLTSQNYQLEFVEKNDDLNHEVWSVGLSEREDSGVNFYINLLDNGPYHEGDVCIGKVVDGFDNLKKLLAVPIHEETKHLDPAISIRSATVTTVPREETAE